MRWKDFAKEKPPVGIAKNYIVAAYRSWVEFGEQKYAPLTVLNICTNNNGEFQSGQYVVTHWMEWPDLPQEDLVTVDKNI